MYIKKVLFIVFTIVSVYATACHQSTANEVSATDNGDGTYDYEIEVCMGAEDTWGFELTFADANIISATDCITNPANGETICSSGITGGYVEYGDHDQTNGTIFNEGTDGVACFILSFTLDNPSSEVYLYGTEYDFGPCDDTENLTTCFVVLGLDATVTDATGPCVEDGEITATASNGTEPYTYTWSNGETGSTITNLQAGEYTVSVTDNEGCEIEGVYTVDSPTAPDYTVVLTTADCRNGPDVEWVIEDDDGTTIGSGALAQDGLSRTYNVCGCANALNLTVPEGTGAGANLCTNDMAPDGEIEVFDSGGNSFGTASADGETIALDCVTLPVSLKKVNYSYDPKNSVNRIEWITSTEINNNFFSVEHSVDGETWRPIGKVYGKGNSVVENEYTFVHEHYAENRINYYKLSQTDFDGESEEISLFSVNNKSNIKRVKTVNMIGQEVSENYSGIVIDYYDDGSTVKSYR